MADSPEPAGDDHTLTSAPADGMGDGIRHYRAIFISDVHLGTPSCKADRLVNFLERHSCETLFLVGDIIDGLALKRSIFWTSAQTDVVRAVLRKARTGTRVIYVPGNHDAFLRSFGDASLLGIDLREETTHETAAGERLLVIHGDRFDGPVRYGGFVRRVGTWAYRLTLRLNDLGALWCRLTGRDYWSFSNFLKRNMGQAARFIESYETWAAREAESRGFDGVVCGHIHHPAMRRIGPVLYCNDGDWVETCTALVETEDGALFIVRWTRPDAVTAAREIR